MTSEQIQQNNYKIALFMGAKEDYWLAKDRFEDTNEGALYLYYDEVENQDYVPPNGLEDWCIPVEELQYHSSFDWLMPVVHKINKPRKGRNNMLKIEHNICSLMYYFEEVWAWKEIDGYEFNIEGVYQAVCKTINLIHNE